VKAPAVKNMSAGQLIDAIELGEMIATGERDLRELDERSLQLRGKEGMLKRKREGEAVGIEEEEEHLGSSVEGSSAPRKAPPLLPAQKKARPEPTAGSEARLDAILKMGKREEERQAAISARIASGESHMEAWENERQARFQKDEDKRAAAIQERMLYGELLSEAEDNEREVARLEGRQWAKEENVRQKAIKEYLKSIASEEELEKERTRAEVQKKKSSDKKSEMADIWAKFMADKGGMHTPDDAEAITAVRDCIASDTSLTLYRRNVLTLLTQVPRGRYTTYKALSAAMHTLSQATNYKLDLIPGSILRELSPHRGISMSCARSVGSAMRNNPFAPLAPCHRVLAANGKIGGFGGDWGEEGRFVNEKRKLLAEEGVRFDGRGKVTGEPFEDFFVP